MYYRKKINFCSFFCDISDLAGTDQRWAGLIWAGILPSSVSIYGSTDYKQSELYIHLYMCSH